MALSSLPLIPITYAASANKINIKIDATPSNSEPTYLGGDPFLKTAKGVLVFSNIMKAGFGVGKEYGDGALRADDKTRGFYNTFAASIGFQLGAQSKSIVLVFMNDKALQDFRNSEGWKVGADGLVAMIEGARHTTSTP